VYALGCHLHYLLTGKRLFDADTSMGLLLHHVQTIPQPPSARSEQYIPREIDDLVMHCLQKDPNRRPHNAEDVLHRASAIRGDWDHRSARQWWETHLPHLSSPSTFEGDPLCISSHS
jgi:serine/threonine-protein kinase